MVSKVQSMFSHDRPAWSPSTLPPEPTARAMAHMELSSHVIPKEPAVPGRGIKRRTRIHMKPFGPKMCTRKHQQSTISAQVARYDQQNDLPCSGESRQTRPDGSIFERLDAAQMPNIRRRCVNRPPPLAQRRRSPRFTTTQNR